MTRVHMICLATIWSTALAGGASANSGGRTGVSGAAGQNCTSCHTSTTPAPQITITGLGGELPAGASVVLTVKIHSTDLTGGDPARCPNRCTGFNAATDGAGTFVAIAGEPVRVSLNGGEATHTARQPFDTAGDVELQINLTGLVAGAHTLYVAASDVDGNTTTNGDRCGAATFPFTVGGASGGEGEGEGEGEGDGGPAGEGEGEGEGEDATDAGPVADDASCACSATPASPARAAAFLLVCGLLRGARPARRVR